MDRVIVELLPAHSNHVERRYVFENGKVTIGRSYSNNIILDDPFVSPEHLLIERRNGYFQVTDLASENGTKINGSGILKDHVGQIQSGDEILIGKSRLKLLLPDHPVAPAKPMGRFMALRSFLDRKIVAIGFTVIALAIMVGVSYLSTPSNKFWKGTVFGLIVGYLFFGVLYSCVIGWIINFKFHKEYFKRHFAVINTMALVSILYSAVSPFMFFWVLDVGLYTFLNYMVMYLLLLGMFWMSLRLTKDIPTRGDFVRLASVTLCLTIFSAWGADAIDLKFSSEPSFTSHLAPYLGPLTEVMSPDSFLLESGKALFKEP
jgi:hypothetical protein